MAHNLKTLPILAWHLKGVLKLCVVLVLMPLKTEGRSEDYRTECGLVAKGILVAVRDRFRPLTVITS